MASDKLLLVPLVLVVFVLSVLLLVLLPPPANWLCTACTIIASLGVAALAAGCAVPL